MQQPSVKCIEVPRYGTCTIQIGYISGKAKGKCIRTSSQRRFLLESNSSVFIVTNKNRQSHAKNLYVLSTLSYAVGIPCFHK